MAEINLGSKMRCAIFNFVQQNPYCTLQDINSAIAHLRNINYTGSPTSNSVTVTISQINKTLAKHELKITASLGRGAVYELRRIRSKE